MRRILLSICLLSFSFIALAGTIDQIIPKPQSATILKGEMRIKGPAIKCDPAMDQMSIEVVKKFAGKLSLVSGYTSSVSTPVGLHSVVNGGSAKGIIFLKDNSLQKEAYRISIGEKAAIIRANDQNGFLYAVQTIMQLLPESIYGKKPSTSERWALPCCEISDSPRFAYRGMHLDSARHFWSVEQVKKYLDVMAYFKLNRFHWHLSDDQGWRIEIKSYPDLTRIGSFREGTMIGRSFSSNDNIRYGGHYTQEQIKDVVNYAARLGIEVVPEIDLPGHMLAALTAYPHLGCTGGPYATWTKWGVSDQVLCVGKESTFDFLEAVLGEVAELFPGRYVHIGGDECPKTEWEKCPDCQAKIAELGLADDEHYSAEQYLQSYVTRRMQDYLATKGKKIIGWDEILEGSIGEGATVMSWRGAVGAQKAASMGLDAILTPGSNCYFDYCQSEDTESEPVSFPATLLIEKVYALDPFEGIDEDKRHHIIGVQGNLWTEYIKTPEHLEYMLLPRLLALSEVQWCTAENRDYGRFTESLENH
ncbi:MAG: beta-N-acetylhexosaminidase, partial [Bacteroidales bacterium]|nr:beta-N-acetylhexosaminidase [Bacteroidales bacterium]